MRRAIELARRACHKAQAAPSARWSCGTVKSSARAGTAWSGRMDPTAHGEVTAIRDACAKLGTFSLEGCEIHTTGQPCPMCLGAIHWARIGRIYYGFRIEDAAEIGFDDTEFFRQMALPAERAADPRRGALPGGGAGACAGIFRACRAGCTTDSPHISPGKSAATLA